MEKTKNEIKELKFLVSELFELWEDLAMEGELVSNQVFISRYLIKLDQVKEVLKDDLL